MREKPGEHPKWGNRIAWFIALWLAGVATVAVVAYAIRWALIS
jgi:hypothetical protein